MSLITNKEEADSNVQRLNCTCLVILSASILFIIIGYGFGDISIRFISATPFATQTKQEVPDARNIQMNAVNISNKNLIVTIFTFIGIEGSGHHLFQTVIRKMTKQIYHDNTNNIKIIKKYAHLGKCKQIKSKHLHRMIKMVELYENNPDINHILFPVTTQESYPCAKPRIYPNMTHLMEIVYYANMKSNISFIFNLRYIVLKRDWIECVVSSCIHRHRSDGCKGNSKNQFHGKMVIEQQLKIIPQKHWIIIDFHDLTNQKYEYAKILSEWLNIDNTKLVEKSLSVIKSVKGNIDSVRNAWRLADLYDQQQSNKYNNSFNLTQYMMQAFYSEETRNSLWNDNCFLVTPNNTQFINPLHFCKYQW